MDSNRIQDWLQVVGMFGVIASLVFVGLEMRQTKDIALSAAYQARADSSMAIRLAPLDSPELQSALVKILLASKDELTDAERIANRFWFYAGLVYLENVHYQYLQGFVSEEQWQSNLDDIQFIFSVEENRKTWREQPVAWRKSFKDVLDAAVEAAEAR